MAALTSRAIPGVAMGAGCLALILVLSLSLPSVLGGATTAATDPCGAQFPAPNIQTTVTHQGDLVLSGSDSLAIENQKYVINGNIYLSGNARLTVRNSELEVQHYPRQEIFVSGQATLEAENTIFSDFIHSSFSDQSTLTMDRVFLINLIDLGGQAQVTIRNSCLFQEGFGLVQAGGQVQVTIEDSVVGAIGLWIPPEPPIAIDGLKPGYFEHWSAQEDISSSLAYNVVLDRTEVKENPGYSGGFEMGWNIDATSDADLTISNSVLNKLVINFDNEDVQFSGLVRGEPVDFDYRSLHVRDTEVQNQWGIFVSNGETRIDDSDGVWLWPVGTKDTIVSNTAVNEFDPRQYTGTIYLANCSMTNGFEIFDNSVFRLEGSVRMLEIVPTFTADSFMTRNYEVLVIDGRDGTPLSDLDLSLTKDGAPVWSGKTDVNGQADFDITFDMPSQHDTWTLSTSDPSIALSKAISIYTDTPVTISLEPGPDGQRLWPAAYVDCDEATSDDRLRAGPYGPMREIADCEEDASYNGSRETPYCKIWQAAKAVAGGGLVRVAPGTCREMVTLENNVMLLGAGADITTIEGNVSAQDVTDAWISGFTIVDDNTAGIHCYDSTLTTTNNAIRDQPHNGIHSSNCSLTARNNALVGNGHNGILLSGSSQATVENNVFAGNGDFGVRGEGGSAASSDYNVLWQNGEGGYAPGFAPGAHDVSSNPLFLAADDYRLLAASLCIDAGNPDAQHNDLDGSRNDIGPFGGLYAPATNVSLRKGWNHVCYLGPDQSIETALAPIINDVAAVYRLRAGEGFDGWFGGKPQLSTIATLTAYQPLLLLMTDGAAWYQTAAATSPSSVNLAQGWNAVCYGGQTKTTAEATSAIGAAFGVLYRLGINQLWGRYLPGAPDISNVAGLGRHDPVLILVTQEGGTTWTFDP